VSVTNNDGQVSRREYDARNNLVRSIDARGNVSVLTYDGLNRLVHTDRLLTTTGDGTGTPTGPIRVTQTWDDNSRIVQRTDPVGNLTRYTYDDLDRLIRTERADGTVSELAYDVHSNPVTHRDANSTVQTSTYDALDRKTRVVFTPGPGVSPVTTFEQFGYDGLSRLVLAEDDDSIVTRGYDSLSRIILETLNGVRTDSLFDGVGNRLSLIYPSGHVITNAFDAADRLAAIGDDLGLIARYTYRGGQAVRKDFGNGTRQSLTYDTLRRVATVVHSQAPHEAPQQFDNLALTWSPTSQKISRRQQLPGGLSQTYQYDSMDRLTHSDSTPAVSTPRSITYTLDAAGNRLAVAGGSDRGPYTLSPANPPADAQVHQYTSTPMDTRTYDANGNLRSGAAASDILYDVRDRMVKFTGSGTGVAALYKYDALGRRIEKQVTTTPLGGALTVATTRFFYCENSIVEQQGDLPDDFTRFTYGVFVDEPLTMDRPDGRFFYHADDLYSISQITDSLGQRVESYQYADYGEPIITTPDGTPLSASAVGNPILFVGRHYDDETGLFEFRRRYLDPRSGRFTTRDPIGPWGDALNMGNGYTYVGNSPLSRLDPAGMKQSAAREALGNTGIAERALELEHQVVAERGGKFEAYYGAVHHCIANCLLQVHYPGFVARAGEAAWNILTERPDPNQSDYALDSYHDMLANNRGQEIGAQVKKTRAKKKICIRGGLMVDVPDESNAATAQLENACASSCGEAYPPELEPRGWVPPQLPHWTPTPVPGYRTPPAPTDFPTGVKY